MSNQFYFTFAVVVANHNDQISSHPNRNTSSSSSSPPSRVRKVLPSNIDEARRMATRIHLEQQQKEQFR